MDVDSRERSARTWLGSLVLVNLAIGLVAVGSALASWSDGRGGLGLIAAAIAFGSILVAANR